MPRNLERRLELMTPIYDEKLKAKLSRILRLQLSDDALAYSLDKDGEYEQITKVRGKGINSQEKLEDYVNQIDKTQKKEGDQGRVVKLVSKLFKESWI